MKEFFINIKMYLDRLKKEWYIAIPVSYFIIAIFLDIFPYIPILPSIPIIPFAELEIPLTIFSNQNIHYIMVGFLIAVFLIAGFRIFIEQTRKLSTTEDLNIFQNEILNILRDLEPDISYSCRAELNQIIFQISGYWSIDGQLHSCFIGNIILFHDPLQLNVSYRSNPRGSDPNVKITIEEVVESIKNNLQNELPGKVTYFQVDND